MLAFFNMSSLWLVLAAFKTSRHSSTSNWSRISSHISFFIIYLLVCGLEKGGLPWRFCMLHYPIKISVVFNLLCWDPDCIIASLGCLCLCLSVFLSVFNFYSLFIFVLLSIFYLLLLLKNKILKNVSVINNYHCLQRASLRIRRV